jgi:pimeloyl-ACP methyl ester carboxylesterase
MANYASPRSPRSSQPTPPSPLAQQLPLVSARWLIACLVAIFGGGLALVYLTMCFLFWQGQWQILFHPSRVDQAVSASFSIEDVRFGPNEAGQPQLDGWFVASAGRYAGKTILYLHDTSAGSLSAAATELDTLHRIGINIFAFDYRGFGKSAGAHPSEKLATEDTEAAWQYLVNTRHIPPASIVIYGQGLGASLAAEAAARHPDAAGVVLDSPSPTALQLLKTDPRSHGLPVSLLAHDRFDPSPALQALKQSKLFLLPDSNQVGARYAQLAAEPKLIVHLPTGPSDSEKQESIRRFLDEK